MSDSNSSTSGSEVETGSDWEPNDSDLRNAYDDESDFDASDHTIPEQYERFSIEPRIKKSKTGPWVHFGYLKRDGKTVRKYAERSFCKPCLENNTFKR